MPIGFMCPSCSANFKVKDEVAGKRIKCPKCGEPLTVPGGEAPAPARPATKPRPVEDDEDDRSAPKRRREDADESDEKPRAKKRRDVDNEEEEEKPRSKKRREEDDDRPKKKRRRDDAPEKKGSALPLILGIVGGVLLLCGGGCAGVWFGMIVPAAEKQRQLNDAKQAELDRWEKEFGKPQPNPGPFQGQNPSPGVGRPTGTKPPTTYAKSSKPIAVLSPDEFARDFTKYIDQWVVVKGKLAKELGEFDEWDALEFERAEGPKFQFGGIGSTVFKGGVKKGTVVEVWGFVADPMYFADKRHELRLPLLLSTPVTVSAAELLDDYRKTPKNKPAKYDGQTFRLTGTVRRFDSVKQVIFEEKMFDGTKYVLLVNFESADIDNLKVGETITALVRGRELEDNSDGKLVHLLNARLISKDK